MGDLVNMSPPSIQNTSEIASISTKIMVISMIVLFFIIAFCFLFSLYARRFLTITPEDSNIVSWRRRTARQGRQPAPAKRRGLDQATLQSLPVTEYDPKDAKEGLEECSVCLSELTKGEKVRILPKCNHGFHVECIDMWFTSHSTCPLCRNSLTSYEVLEKVEGGHSLTDSDSDSDSDLDLDSSQTGESHVSNIGEGPSFPTNVLIWGNNEATTSTSSNLPVSELVIDIPREVCDEEGKTPVCEEVKTPVVLRMKSFKRLLSRGKRVVSLASGSNSNNIELV